MMGLFSGLTGGNAARALREQARQLEQQQAREQGMYSMNAEAVNSARLDLFEKDRLADMAQQQALDQLDTPGATLLLGGDPDAARKRRAGFYTSNTTAKVEGQV